MDSRARSAATLGVLVMLCLVGILVGIRALTADLPTDPLVESTTEQCENRNIAQGKKIRAEEITVSVFNAGSKAGAASRVMKELQTRGFADGDSGNAPKGTEVIRAQVWSDSPRNSAARLVALQLGAGIKVFAEQAAARSRHRRRGRRPAGQDAEGTRRRSGPRSARNVCSPPVS